MFTTDLMVGVIDASVARAAQCFFLLSGHCSSCSFMSLIAHLVLKDATVHGRQCSPTVLSWKMRCRVIPVMMCDQSWCLISIGGSPGTKMPSYTAQARHSRLYMSVKSTRGTHCQGCCSTSWHSHTTLCSRAMPRSRSCKQQHFVHRHHWPPHPRRHETSHPWHRASCEGVSWSFSGCRACPSLYHM